MWIMKSGCQSETRTLRDTPGIKVAVGDCRAFLRHVSQDVGAFFNLTHSMACPANEDRGTIFYAGTSDIGA